MDSIQTWEEMEQSGQWDDYNSMAREFARRHVTAALKAAIEQVKTKNITIPNCDDHTPYWGACVTCGLLDNPDVIIGSEIDKESILSAYPLTSIK